MSRSCSNNDARILVGQFRKTGEIVIYDPTRQRGSKAGEVYLYRMRFGGMATFDVDVTRAQVKRIENEKVRRYALRAYRKWERDTGGRLKPMIRKEPRIQRVADCWNCGVCLKTQRHPICQKCGWIRCPVCGACGCGYEKD